MPPGIPTEIGRRNGIGRAPSHLEKLEVALISTLTIGLDVTLFVLYKPRYRIGSDLFTHGKCRLGLKIGRRTIKDNGPILYGSGEAGGW